MVNQSHLLARRCLLNASRTVPTRGVVQIQALALEDSSNGLKAAMAAGIATIITPNPFTAHHDFTGALRVVPDLSQVSLADLCEWQNSARA